MQYFLSVDAGTTSFKAAIYDENWNRVSWAAEGYKVHTPAQDIVEYDTEDYWRLFCNVTKGAIEKAGISAFDIASVAIDSQGETVIALDKEGKPVGKAIVWLDNRSTKEAEELEKTFGLDLTYKLTGQPEIVATWSATEILWLKKNRPELYAKTDKFLLLEDYLMWCLTGEFVGEKSLYPSSLYFDIIKGDYWDDMLKAIGITRNQLPTIMDSGMRVGGVLKTAAAQCGLAEGTPVITGALDQASAMIGAGNCAEGLITETTGTALAVCATVDGYKCPAREIGLTMQSHAIPGMYYWLMWAPAAGLALEWFKNNFYMDINDGTGKIFDIINKEAETAPAGSDGLIMLPHLCGAGTPEYNSKAKGVFFGVSTRHTRGHFSRAIMESIAYMIRRDVELLKTAGLNPSQIRSLGGGAKSPLWNQIKADITGTEIVNLTDSETTNLGTAIIAAAGVGKYSSIAEASREAAKVRASYVPKQENAEVYNEAFHIYKETYESLLGVFEKTSK
jgi:xylulokinase